MKVRRESAVPCPGNSCRQALSGTQKPKNASRGARLVNVAAKCLTVEIRAFAGDWRKSGSAPAPMEIAPKWWRLQSAARNDSVVRPAIGYRRACRNTPYRPRTAQDSWPEHAGCAITSGRRSGRQQSSGRTIARRSAREGIRLRCLRCPALNQQTPRNRADSR